MVVSERVLARASAFAVAAALAAGGALAPVTALASDGVFPQVEAISEAVGTGTDAMIVAAEKVAGGSLVSKEVSVSAPEAVKAITGQTKESIVKVVGGAVRSGEVAAATRGKAYKVPAGSLYEILFEANGLVPKPHAPQLNPFHQLLFGEFLEALYY